MIKHSCSSNFASLDQAKVRSYLLRVAFHLGLRTYGDPIVHAPGGTGKKENEGFDAFVPLIDSGISLYVWSSAKFFAVLLFTCKTFDVEGAIDFTRDFFGSEQVEYKRF
ncbi:S-adenosylmethionine decarboxylase [Litchfieldella anticariensis]|uniref:S-adenosylmethionine decarboxylase n=1 Tax=Litchfieldella anticariensis TaxID=258591 RepID=UPI0035300FB5